MSKVLMKKIKISAIVFFVLFITFTMNVYAEGSYTINGVTVRYTDFTSLPDECWDYAQNIYNKIWGTSFSSLFSTNDNMLRNLNDNELTLTVDHLKTYVSNASLGSCLRICNSEYLHAHDGWGHSQIIVQKDANGFAVLEGGLSAYPYCREKYYTWSEYCNTGWLGGTYSYIKYIKWPGAQAYSGSNNSILFDTFSVENVTENGAKICAWGRNSGTMQELGFYIGIDGAYQNQSRIVVTRNVAWTDFHMQYDINSYYGTLNPGETYRYSFFCVKEGLEYKSYDATFTTIGTSYISFDSISTANISSEGATIKCWGSNPGGYTLSSVGFEISTSFNSLNKKTYEVFKNINWTRPEFSFNVNDYCEKLIPNPDKPE